ALPPLVRQPRRRPADPPPAPGGRPLRRPLRLPLRPQPALRPLRPQHARALLRRLRVGRRDRLRAARVLAARPARPRDPAAPGPPAGVLARRAGGERHLVRARPHPPAAAGRGEAPRAASAWHGPPGPT